MEGLETLVAPTAAWKRTEDSCYVGYGYSEKIIRILEKMYKDTFSTVRVNGEISDWFGTIVGVL